MSASRYSTCDPKNYRLAGVSKSMKPAPYIAMSIDSQIKRLLSLGAESV